MYCFWINQSLLNHKHVFHRSSKGNPRGFVHKVNFSWSHIKMASFPSTSFQFPTLLVIIACSWGQQFTPNLLVVSCKTGIWVCGKFFQRLEALINVPSQLTKGNFVSGYIYIELNLFCMWANFARSCSISPPLPVCVCLCSCRTSFYKIENIFPDWCKLLSNNRSPSLVIIPVPPGQAQINGLLWTLVNRMNYGIILRIWQPQYMGDRISASVVLWWAPGREGFAVLQPILHFSSLLSQT